MRLHRSILGLATTLAVAAGCSSNDSTVSSPDAAGPTDAAGGTAHDSTAAQDSGSGAREAAADASADAPMADGTITPATDGPSAAANDATGDVVVALADGAAGTGDALADALADASAATLLDSGAVCGPLVDGGTGLHDGGAIPVPSTSFFVSSATSPTGNLGGLTAADARCQTLAVLVGLGSKTWHAYLSVEHDAANGNNPANARDRIGAGPWYNSRGVLVAADLASLHGRTGDAAVFLDEHGAMIKGQWTGSGTPVEHDILTGSNPDGTLAVGKTCLDWTSAAPAATGVPDGGELSVARVGHTDGLGPMCSTATSPTNYTSWSSAHDNAGCDNTAPRGGAGRIYCFAIN